MPRFFIDTSDQDLFVHDDVGQDFPDLEAAKEEAVATLPDMARDKLPDGDSRVFLAVVRGEDGRTLIQASLSLQVTSLTPSADD